MSTENQAKADNRDQADIVADNERLTTENTRLQGDVTRLTTELGTEKAAHTDAIGKATTAEAKVTELTQQNATLTTERDEARQKCATLEATDRDFNRRLASELARHGVRGAEGTTGAKQEDKPKTWTERAKEAREAAGAKK